MKRVILFLITNLAVMLVLSATLRILGLDRYITAQGLNVNALLVFSVVVGFTGSIISLLISKPMAKFSTGAQVIDPNAPRNQREAWLLDTVYQLADRAGIGRPEVAIYDGAPNAFATGAFKNDALVAVSTGLLESMSEEEVAAVLGHEVAHVANGDMVTLTLIQGVVNTFVVFLARVVGYFVDRTIFRTERGTGPGFYITVIVCEIVFGVLAPSSWPGSRASANTAPTPARPSCWRARAHDPCPGPPGRRGARRAAQVLPGLGHCRRRRDFGAVLLAPAHPRPDRGPAADARVLKTRLPQAKEPGRRPGSSFGGRGG